MKTKMKTIAEQICNGVPKGFTPLSYGVESTKRLEITNSINHFSQEVLETAASVAKKHKCVSFVELQRRMDGATPQSRIALVIVKL